MMRISIAAGMAAAWLVSQPTGQQWDVRSIDPTMIATVEAQRAASFARERNAEIDASIAAVEAQRAASFARERNAEIDASIAAVEAQRTAAFARERNAEIDASIAAVEAQRAASFARERNAEIDASIAAVEAQRQALVRAGVGSVATSAGASTRTYGGETWRPRPIQSRKSGSGTL